MQQGYCLKCGRAAVRKRILRSARSEAPARPYITTAYVCTLCGYTERYISADELSTIATSPEWQAVPPSDEFDQPAATGTTIRLEPQHAYAEAPLQLEDTDACPHCGSDLIIPRVRVRDMGQGGTQHLTVSIDQPGWFFDVSHGTLSADICGDCGYTRLFVEDPARLYEAYRQARERD